MSWSRVAAPVPACGGPLPTTSTTANIINNVEKSKLIFRRQLGRVVLPQAPHASIADSCCTIAPS